MKINGGLGIIDLQCQKDALLVKWLWNIENCQESQWANTFMSLHGVNSATQIQSIRQDISSFFVKDLVNLLPFFKYSIDQDGGTSKWGWSALGVFSCSLAYRAMHNEGFISSTQKPLWIIKVPMKVMIFIWLMLDNKILTQNVLTYRGCPIPTGCHLCGKDIVETKDHIM